MSAVLTVVFCHLDCVKLVRNPSSHRERRTIDKNRRFKGLARGSVMMKRLSNQLLQLVMLVQAGSFSKASVIE
jgi:hypothetical protein